MIPGVGEFLAGIVLGERAVETARRSKLPRTVIEMIEAATPYAEGRGIRLPVRNKEDLVNVQELVSIKMGA